jgi:hypothetical protein
LIESEERRLMWPNRSDIVSKDKWFRLAKKKKTPAGDSLQIDAFDM